METRAQVRQLGRVSLPPLPLSLPRRSLPARPPFSASYSAIKGDICFAGRCEACGRCSRRMKSEKLRGDFVTSLLPLNHPLNFSRWNLTHVPSNNSLVAMARIPGSSQSRRRMFPSNSAEWISDTYEGEYLNRDYSTRETAKRCVGFALQSRAKVLTRRSRVESILRTGNRELLPGRLRFLVLKIIDESIIETNQPRRAHCRKSSHRSRKSVVSSRMIDFTTDFICSVALYDDFVIDLPQKAPIYSSTTQKSLLDSSV